MNLQSSPDAVLRDIDEQALAEYLRAHPDFFVRHPELVETLHIPHPTRGAVSLTERLIERLRERNRRLERKLAELVEVARENERLSAHLQRLAVGLLRADSLDSTLATARELLCNEFQADLVALLLIDHDRRLQAPYAVAPDTPKLAEFRSVLDGRRPYCGRLTPPQATWLFGPGGEGVASAAVVPLHGTRPLGLLALGSADAHRFHPSMGTLFLGYLGDLLAAAIGVWLERDGH